VMEPMFSYPTSTPKMDFVIDGVFNKLVFVEPFVCFFSISPNKSFLFHSLWGDETLFSYLACLSFILSLISLCKFHYLEHNPTKVHRPK